MSVSAFWDTSALVPLCIRQSSTERAIELYQQYEALVWWATPVELTSAMMRLLRMKQIEPSEMAQARRLARKLGEEWTLVQPSNKLRSKAERLLERYELRAGDALQLAAALEWCEDTAHGRVFLTTDRKLREAALRSGFEVRAI